MSTNTLGSPDLDLRPSEMQRSTMDTWLQLCPSCGYSAPDIRAVPEDTSVYRSDHYRAALGRDDFPELARRFLAYAHASGSADPASVGHAFLQAAWVCDDAGESERAAESRAWAAEWFRRRKPFADDEEGLAIGAVLVDVLRRCGRFAEASAECSALLGLPSVTGVVRQVLQFQERLIAGGDRGLYRVSDSRESA